MRVRVGVVVATLALVAGLMGSTGSSPAAAEPEFVVRPSVNQLAVLDAEPGTEVELLDSAGDLVGSGSVDELGSLLWRELDAGDYAVRVAGETSGPYAVSDFDDPAPDPSLYTGQTLEPGFGYLATRDGTTLSVQVQLPAGKGPFPTVVEYSGYDPSNPANATMPMLYNMLGYAYVGVNVRGTGCSGGSFMTFEPIQSIDGYDVIETVAAQSWVKHHQVGMVGISYPGIEQLYVARAQPPSLAAITPLAVIDDTYRSTLYPGGILNTGFAVPWAEERAEQARRYGQSWTRERADAGDTECADNQRVRLQNVDLGTMIDDHPHYTPEVHDQINPSEWADRIEVPVFLAGAWQDEQTGGHFPALLERLSGAPHVYASLVNGSHTEALSLGVLGRYADFLDLYVARRVPDTDGARQLVGPMVAQFVTGVGGLKLPPQVDYSGLTYKQALAKFESRKPIEVLFEEGAAKGQPAGSPLPRFTRSFASWPIPSIQPRRWFLGSGGKLRAQRARAAADATPRSYRADPGALPATTYTGSEIWSADPDYDWRQIPDGTGLGWISRPLKKTIVAVGTGSVDLWIRSDAPDTDLEVTLSEIRPDGTEVYVQSGWLRASHRKLDRERSTIISPRHTNLEADAAPLPSGELTRVRVELFPFAQAFRAGSRIRVTVDAPGGARPTWAFAETIADGERVEVATDRVHRSRLVLPVVPGVKVPKKAPACVALRSQPCRTYP